MQESLERATLQSGAEPTGRRPGVKVYSYFNQLCLYPCTLAIADVATACKITTDINSDDS